MRTIQAAASTTGVSREEVEGHGNDEGIECMLMPKHWIIVSVKLSVFAQKSFSSMFDSEVVFVTHGITYLLCLYSFHIYSDL